MSYRQSVMENRHVIQASEWPITTGCLKDSALSGIPGNVNKSSHINSTHFDQGGFLEFFDRKVCGQKSP